MNMNNNTIVLIVIAVVFALAIVGGVASYFVSKHSSAGDCAKNLACMEALLKKYPDLKDSCGDYGNCDKRVACLSGVLKAKYPFMRETGVLERLMKDSC